MQLQENFPPQFESCVVLDGDKTPGTMGSAILLFESCVVLDGDKTRHQLSGAGDKFESCVVLDGDKTEKPVCSRHVQV